MIELNGLTPRHVELLDTIWSIDSHQEVMEYIETLSDEDQLSCQTLIRLIMLELIDQTTDELPGYKEANKALEKYRLT